MRLPTFLIIGAQRSGTTSLHYSLAQHPEIFMSVRKEVNFFLRGSDGSMPVWVDPETEERTPRSFEEYAALFADAGQEHRAIGETSPSYLYGPVAARVAQLLPEAKLIVSLRHPVEQARSILATWLGRRPGLDELSDWLETGRPGPRGEMPLHRHGQYAEHLKAYYARFPREQIMICKFGTLHRDPDGLFARIAQFVGVTPRRLLALHLNATTSPRLALVNYLLGAKRVARSVLPERLLRSLVPAAHVIQSWNTSERTCVPADFRAMLTAQYYAADIQRLERMSGLRFDSWRDEELERDGQCAEIR